MGDNTDSLRRKARHLYAQGMTVEDIAPLVDRSEKTVYRWRSDDEADWEELRAQASAQDPHALLGELQAMRQELVEKARAADADPGSFTDSLWKLQRVLQSIRDEIGDVSTVMGVLEGFAQWSAEHATEDEREVLRRLAAEYTAELREENA